MIMNFLIATLNHQNVARRMFWTEGTKSRNMFHFTWLSKTQVCLTPPIFCCRFSNTQSFDVFWFSPSYRSVLSAIPNLGQSIADPMTWGGQAPVPARQIKRSDGSGWDAFAEKVLVFLHDSDRFKSTDHNAGTSLFWHQNGRVLQQVAAMWCLAFFFGKVSTERSFIVPSCVAAWAVVAAHGCKPISRFLPSLLRGKEKCWWR